MNRSLHYLMMITQNSFYKEVIAQAGMKGLMPGQPKVLEYLEEHDSCTQREIVDECNLDKSTMTGILGRMEQRGLISKKKDGIDNRKIRVSLTEEGQKASKEVDEIFNLIEKKAWQGISEEQQDMFSNLLEHIYQNMTGNVNEKKQ